MKQRISNVRKVLKNELNETDKSLELGNVENRIEKMNLDSILPKLKDASKSDSKAIEKKVKPK